MMLIPTLTFRAFWASLGQAIEWPVSDPLPVGLRSNLPRASFVVEINFMVLGASTSTGGTANPDRAETVEFSLSAGSSSPVSRKTWTYRRDFRPTDAFLAPSSGAVSIETDSVFRVRYHPAWTPGRSFQYRGDEWTARGVSRVRRLGLLDVLARRSESA